MTTAEVLRNPTQSVEAWQLTDRLIAAPTIAAEERIAGEHGLTLAQARAVGILVTANRQDTGLALFLARDDEMEATTTAIAAKIAEYGRTETPAVSRLVYREIMVLVAAAAARGARIATDARGVLQAEQTRQTA